MRFFAVLLCAVALGVVSGVFRAFDWAVVASTITYLSGWWSAELNRWMKRRATGK